MLSSTLRAVLAAACAGLVLVPATARADGGATISTATPVVYGAEQTGDTANGYHAQAECPTYRSWWALNATVGQEITVAWRAGDQVSAFVFPAGTTDTNLSTPAQAPRRSNIEYVTAANDSVHGTFVITAGATGVLPLEFTSTTCDKPAGGYSFTATVRDAPTAPSASFLADWKAADQAVANWDLKRARKLLAPLLAQNTALDQERRLWFDLSAARLMSFLGDGKRAKAFAADAATVAPPVLGGGVVPNAYENYPPRTARTATAERPCALYSGDPLTAPAIVLQEGLESSDWVEFVSHDHPRKGGGGAISSFFAGNVAGTIGPLCHTYYVTFSGGATGVQSGTSRYTIVIPSTEPIVKRRKLARGAKVTAQAFAVKSSAKVVATWRRYAKGATKPNLTIRAAYRVRDETLTVRAPTQPGSWDLQLGVGTNKDFSTGVTRITIR